MIHAQPSTDREIDARDLGRRIAQARYESGWMTQKTLAELLCVCRPSVQAYEARKTIPYRHLHRLQEIFEKPASWVSVRKREPLMPSVCRPRQRLVDSSMEAAGIEPAQRFRRLS